MKNMGFFEGENGNCKRENGGWAEIQAQNLGLSGTANYKNRLSIIGEESQRSCSEIEYKIGRTSSSKKKIEEGDMGKNRTVGSPQKSDGKS